jgi:hypothetical protein
MNEETSEQPGTPEEKFGTVLVSGLPEGATENALHIHFQKKKNGGGEVKEVKLLQGKKAIVVFEDIEGSVFSYYPIKRLNIAVLGPSVRRECVFISSILNFSVAKRVVDTPQVFKGRNLTVILQEAEGKPDNEKSEDESIDESRAILVSDLPAGTSESAVHIHFQKKKSGGGEIEKVIILEGNKAMVVFEELEGTPGREDVLHIYVDHVVK